MKRVACKAALWLCLLAGSALAKAATVTIAEGEAVLIRDAQRLQLAEGVRLTQDDIVELTAKGRLLRIEFSDGVIVDLGPESRAILAPNFSSERTRLSIRMGLLRGVVKLTLPPALPADAASLATPAYDVTGVARSAVFIVQPTEAYAFAELGPVTLQERSRGKAIGITTLRGGEFFARAGEAKSTVTPRPTPAFIQRLPRAFRDTLPARAARFKTHEVEPKPLGPISFADVEAWINAEGMRSHFAARWKALARDPAFRAGVATNMRAHPEWDRILYPEKYRPKPASAPPAN